MRPVCSKERSVRVGAKGHWLWQQPGERERPGKDRTRWIAETRREWYWARASEKLWDWKRMGRAAGRGSERNGKEGGR
jgi:hypothetical protein